MTLKIIYEEIIQERIRQDKKWGEQNHNDFIWCAILGEEVGEAHMASLERAFGDSEKPNPNGSFYGLRKELIEIAAVSIAWIECLDRENNNDD